MTAGEAAKKVLGYCTPAVLAALAALALMRWLAPVHRPTVFSGLAIVSALVIAHLVMRLRHRDAQLARDLANGREREHELERLGRLYVALGHINQAIVRTDSREALFSQVCEVLVRDVGFRIAWIGLPDPATQRLVPVSRAGDESGYIDAISVHIDDRPEGHGPTGRAFRDNRPYVSNDILADPSSLPWRPELVARGLRASAALPILQGGQVVGALSVYSERSGFFQDKEVELLNGAAVDISFALDNLAREEARAGAEETIKRFAAIVESTDDAIISKTVDGNITSWNPAAESLFGYGADEIVGRPATLLMSAERAEEEAMMLSAVRAGAHVRQFETVRLSKDGTVLPVAITYSPIFGPQPTGPRASGAAETRARELIGISTFVRDIGERKRAEAVVERERRFLTSLIEAMPGVFYLYDQEGRFLRWNNNFVQVSGYGSDEIARLHPLAFFAEGDRGLVERRIGEVFDRGEATVEACFLTKDRREIPYFFTGKRIVFDGLTCLVGVGVDVTESKRVEEALIRSEERYRTTLDSILEGCQLIDFDWRYLYLNDAAAIQNRRPNSELLGKRMPDMWPGIENTPLFTLLGRCMVERRALHEETEFHFADGSAGWFDVRVQPALRGIFVLSIDISERRAAEMALHDLNESLERKVAERTLDLEAAKLAAESADHLKSAFLATMSHELRTPLNSIIGFTGIVLQGLAGPLTAEQTKQLGMVRGSARHLLDLINDVLDISKIEAGQLEMRNAPFDLRASVERVTASVTPMADKKGLQLRVVLPEALEPIDSDRRRVEQVVLNLVNNAIKFTDRGTVTLTVDVVADPARPCVRLRVADTGIGIKPEDLAKLFQPFRQIDAGLQRQHEGTGLGLAISRRLTQLLGGSVHAESVWGQGSEFTVVLPMKPDVRP